MSFADPHLERARKEHLDKKRPTKGDYIAFKAAQQRWMIGKSIAAVDVHEALAVITFTDGTRACFEGDVAAGVKLCGACMDAIEVEPMLFVAEDVECREAAHGRREWP